MIHFSCESPVFTRKKPSRQTETSQDLFPLSSRDAPFVVASSAVRIAQPIGSSCRAARSGPRDCEHCRFSTAENSIRLGVRLAVSVANSTVLARSLFWEGFLGFFVRRLDDGSTTIGSRAVLAWGDAGATGEWVVDGGVLPRTRGGGYLALQLARRVEAARGHGVKSGCRRAAQQQRTDSWSCYAGWSTNRCVPREVRTGGASCVTVYEAALDEAV
jgi:hypothetical protein